jgi:hypothetical protein
MEINQCLRMDWHFLNWVRLVVFHILKRGGWPQSTEVRAARANGGKSLNG